jgi:hypothetical protein
VLNYTFQFNLSSYNKDTSANCETSDKNREKLTWAINTGSMERAAKSDGLPLYNIHTKKKQHDNTEEKTLQRNTY